MDVVIRALCECVVRDNMSVGYFPIAFVSSSGDYPSLVVQQHKKAVPMSILNFRFRNTITGCLVRDNKIQLEKLNQSLVRKPVYFTVEDGLPNVIPSDVYSEHP